MLLNGLLLAGNETGSMGGAGWQNRPWLWIMKHCKLPGRREDTPFIKKKTLLFHACLLLSCRVKTGWGFTHGEGETIASESSSQDIWDGSSFQVHFVLNLLGSLYEHLFYLCMTFSILCIPKLPFEEVKPWHCCCQWGALPHLPPTPSHHSIHPPTHLPYVCVGSECWWWGEVRLERRRETEEQEEDGMRQATQAAKGARRRWRREHCIVS